MGSQGKEHIGRGEDDTSTLIEFVSPIAMSIKYDETSRSKEWQSEIRVPSARTSSTHLLCAMSVRIHAQFGRWDEAKGQMEKNKYTVRDDDDDVHVLKPRQFIIQPGE